MIRILFFVAVLGLGPWGNPVHGQSVTLYTAGPEGLAKNLAKSFTDKTGVKVDVYQATSGDVLARLEAEKS
jgi:accessory colonization factor AcfC